MRRTLIVIAVVITLFSALGFRPSRADAAVGTCAITSYTLTGSFNRLAGATSFHLSASGSCVGAAPVSVDVDYNSIGSWSCDAGVAHGTGLIQSGNAQVVVDSYLANVGGEYVVEVLGSGALAAGQFTTLPIACDLGQTQTTIGGSGTLTFTA